MFKNSADTFTGRTTFFLIGLALCLIAVLFGAQFAQMAAQFALGFNVFGLLSLFGSVILLILVISMARSKIESEEAKWFIFSSIAGMIFAGAEALQRFSVYPSGAIFWTVIEGVAITIVPVGLYLFALSYTRSPAIRVGVVTPVIIFGGILIGVFYAQSDLIFLRDPLAMKLYPWGYNNDPGPLFIVTIAWVLALYGTAIILLLRFWHRSTNALLRRQALLYAAGISVPLVGGIISDMILPILELDFLPPTSAMLEVALASVIFYGIRKYQFFRINPVILAENILKTMNEAVVVTRDDFTIEYMNKEAETLVGSSLDKLPSKYMHALFAPNSWPKLHDYITGQRTEISEAKDLSVLSSQGTQVPVRVFVSRLREGQKYQALVFVISDITDITNSYNELESDASRIRALLAEARALEKQLEFEKANVEHTVTVRTRELTLAQEHLKAADQMKTEFIMLGAHNLRTPLTIMTGSLEMIQIARTAKERQTFVASLEASVNQLKEFVEDMVTITSLESGSGLVMAPVTIVDLIAPLEAEASNLGSTKNVAFKSQVSAGTTLITANLPRLQGAIRNVIGNAFKFTAKGSVELHVKVEAGKAHIRVTDTGIGIGSEEVDKLFTKFHRATGTLQYEYDGEGIGLYLTKLIVEEHHGTITVKSTPGKGSEFTIILPLKQPTT